MPLPEEARALIAAGLGPRLMYRMHYGMITPARKGCEGTVYHDQPERRECTFLDAAGRCELHDRGLKPFTGRMTDHNDRTGEANRIAILAWEAPANTAQIFGEWARSVSAPPA